MKFKLPFEGKSTLGYVLATIGLSISIVLLLGIFYFYIFLPSSTNHGEEIPVPDLTGKNISEIEALLLPLQLRYEVGDSAYSADFPPLTVLQQFPKPGAAVKENRKIYLSVNRASPPTLPLPNLFGEGNSGSLLNAEALLRSNELVRGRVIYQRHPSRDLLIEIRMDGKVVTPGIRIPKGSVIDLVVGDGAGPRDFLVGNFVGMPIKNAILRLGNLSLHQGSISTIPADLDTTDVTVYVLKQFPIAGDSVSIGDPIDLWIGLKGTAVPEEDEEEDEQPTKP
ncbi:hypothetical protein BH10BAC4_BH10BAC4_08440 [soil metagenome]